MNVSEVDLAHLTADEAVIARNAVASHRRNLRRVQAQAAFFEAIVARYHERPNSLRLNPGADAPVMVFGTGIGQVLEPVPDDLLDLYHAWKGA